MNGFAQVTVAFRVADPIRLGRHFSAFTSSMDTEISSRDDLHLHAGEMKLMTWLCPIFQDFLTLNPFESYKQPLTEEAVGVEK